MAVQSNTVTDTVSGQVVAAKGARASSVVTLALKPYEVRAFRVDEPTAALVAWRNQPTPHADLAWPRTIIADAEKLLANRALSKRVLTGDGDQEFVMQQIKLVSEALAAGKTALAWSLLTDSRFWHLTRTHHLIAATAARKVARRTNE